MERSEAEYIELQSDFVILAEEQDSEFHGNVENILAMIGSKTLEVRKVEPLLHKRDSLFAETLLHTRTTPDDERLQHPTLLTSEDQHRCADYCHDSRHRHFHRAAQPFDSIEYLKPTTASLDSDIGGPVPFDYTSIL